MYKQISLKSRITPELKGKKHYNQIIQNLKQRKQKLMSRYV